ncbi:hypothetical protein A2W14_00335 [Candidatus Gottesmanbacteria bacterium RBG_16_37_8]|uniref:DUF2292 domain-containing protein n=1 Tax=Candidatus Gottesmanbacteria bacterium RBG_16_37_8 TaxID=1798371 RepID=A0A1F5YT70_9BACT|nr:MAG: hypothetical protein A2W14_00335 [Candidatus Gottesmanbacteria bacterium RBG_16_37_8]
MSSLAKNTSSIKLINEIQSALEDIMYGSVEVYVQKGKVTQITVRNIKKTDFQVSSKKDSETVQFPVQTQITKTFIRKKV